MQSYKQLKNELIELIKKISTNHGGDDPEWLKGYLDEALEKYKDDLQTALSCFEEIVKQFRGTISPKLSNPST